MLSAKSLSISIQWKQILKDINLNFVPGKNYSILGPNGSGKSSLALAIMGHPKYKITAWTILVDKKSINTYTPHQRAKLWIFLAFQHIPEIQWIKVFEFLKSLYDAKNGTSTSFLQFKNIIDPLLVSFRIDREFLRRDINVGFSWGERRKIEILQLKLLQPTYIFLDEIESWLDVDAFKTIMKILKTINTKKNSLIIITHLFKILDHIPVDEVYVFDKWTIQIKGDKRLIAKIKKSWFTR